MKNKCILNFKTRNNNQYIFDGNSSTVIPVDDIILKCIDLYEKEPIENVKKILEESFPDKLDLIESAINFVHTYSTKFNAFYRDDNYENIKRRWQKNFSTENIQQILNSGNMYQLILNVTEDCNLRCKYCYLSEEYDFTRNRTSKMMSSEIAIKSLDYFFDKLKKIKEFNPGKTCTITFYGGEPLMNFEVVKQSIEYAKKHCPVSVVFNMTTNGVLLKDSTLDYLVKNEVNITVSFDGTRENSNKRVFEKNLESYDTVYTNLKTAKQKYPNYTKLNLISVYDLSTNLIENDLFFENEDLPPVIFVNGVSDNNTYYYSKFTQEDVENHQKQYIYLLNKYIDNKINNKKSSSYLSVLFEASLSPILYRARHKDTKLPMIPFTNTCIPGMKISVRADGKIDMCERVNSTIPVGDIDTGLNLEAIKTLITKYNENVTKKCHLCPLSNICSVCFAQTCGDNCFKSPNCNAIINHFSFLFSVLYSILEENPKAFDRFEPKIEWTIYS